MTLFGRGAGIFEQLEREVSVEVLRPAVEEGSARPAPVEHPHLPADVVGEEAGETFPAASLRIVRGEAVVEPEVESSSLLALRPALEHFGVVPLHRRHPPVSGVQTHLDGDVIFQLEARMIGVAGVGQDRDVFAGVLLLEPPWLPRSRNGTPDRSRRRSRNCGLLASSLFLNAWQRWQRQ